MGQPLYSFWGCFSVFFSRILDTYWPGEGSSFGAILFCLFVLFVGFSRQNVEVVCHSILKYSVNHAKCIYIYMCVCVCVNNPSLMSLSLTSIPSHPSLFLWQSLRYPSLFDPINCCLLGSSVGKIFQCRILEWFAISSSRGSPWPRDQMCVCASPADSLPLCHLGRPRAPGWAACVIQQLLTGCLLYTW